MDELQKFCYKLENEDESYAIVDRIYRSTELFKDYDEEYFKNNGKTLVGDRIKIEPDTTVTLYAENSKGEYEIKYRYGGSVYNIKEEREMSYVVFI